LFQSFQFVLVNMTTDSEWQAWGVRDPYFAVITDPKFRSDIITPEGKLEFFESGRTTVDYVLRMCRRHIDADFTPQRVLDFGCGVGRVTTSFAAQAREVVGMDVAESMLARARQHCDELGHSNVALVQSDDTLSAATGQFDLVHSCLVLQHLELARGRALFAELVRKVRPGGCGAIQLPYGWDKYATTFGVVPAPPVDLPPSDFISRAKAIAMGAAERLKKVRRSPAVEQLPEASPDPEMQMNYYSLSELMFILQRGGVERVFSDFTNHGGALGVFMFFQKTIDLG
jgi:ubiquinone/menaquinone biosynthesis C-methylase UbiE